MPCRPADCSATSSIARTPSRTPSVDNVPYSGPVASTSTSTFVPAPVELHHENPPVATAMQHHPYYPPVSAPPAPHSARPILLPHHRSASYHSNEPYTSTSPISLSLVDVARQKEAALSNLGKTRMKVTARPQAEPITREADPIDHGVLSEAEAAQLFDQFVLFHSLFHVSSQQTRKSQQQTVALTVSTRRSTRTSSSSIDISTRLRTSGKLRQSSSLRSSPSRPSFFVRIYTRPSSPTRKHLPDARWQKAPRQSRSSSLFSSSSSGKNLSTRTPGSKSATRFDSPISFISTANARRPSRTRKPKLD